MEELLFEILVRGLIVSFIVIIAVVAAEKLSFFYASLIGTFPISAGPVYVMLAINQEASFVATSAIYSLASLAAIAPFCTMLIFLVTRVGIVKTIFSSVFVWFLFALPVSQIDWSLASAFLVNIVIYPFCFFLTNKIKTKDTNNLTKKWSWGNVIIRSVIIGIFVASIVTLSNSLGPRFSGLGAVFPIVLIVLSVVLYKYQGAFMVSMTIYSALRIVSGMILVLVVLYYGIVFGDEFIGLILAFFASVFWSLFMIKLNSSLFFNK